MIQEHLKPNNAPFKQFWFLAQDVEAARFVTKRELLKASNNHFYLIPSAVNMLSLVTNLIPL